MEYVVYALLGGLLVLVVSKLIRFFITPILFVLVMSFMPAVILEGVLGILTL